MLVRTYANRHKDQDTHKSNRLFDVSGGNQWPTNAAKLELRNHFIALCQPWSEPTLRDRQSYRSLRTMQTHTNIKHRSLAKSFFELNLTFIASVWEVLLRYPIEALPHRPSNSQLEIQIQTKVATPGSFIFLTDLLFSILSIFTLRGPFMVQMFTTQLMIWITLGSLESWIWYVLQKLTNKFMWDQPYFHWALIFNSRCFQCSFVLRPQCS